MVPIILILNSRSVLLQVTYLLKQDGQPLVWGEFSLEEIRRLIAAGTSSKSATNAGASPKSATKVRASTPALPSNSNSWRRLRLTSSSRSSNDVEIVVATSLEASADGIDQNPFPGSSGCDFLPQYRIWTREDSLPPCGAASEGESVIPPLVGRKSAASSSYAEPTAAPGTARRATGTTGSTTTHCWGAMTIKKGLLFDLPLALTWISCICRERQLVVIGITTWVIRPVERAELAAPKAAVVGRGRGVYFSTNQKRFLFLIHSSVFDWSDPPKSRFGEKSRPTDRWTGAASLAAQPLLYSVLKLMGNPYNSGSKKGLIDSSISKCPIHSFCLSRLFLLRLPLCHRLAEIRVVSKKTGFEDTFQSDTSASALGLSNSKRRHVADSSVEAALKVFRKLVGVRSSRT
uniref:Uncharacterized protein n=1 Tax=Vitis vinifera TaxID=29760 RepID=A5B208_VITVI|nr:hypothetical protein VITISV_029403 [Vitis vinifera]